MPLDSRTSLLKQCLTNSFMQKSLSSSAEISDYEYEEYFTISAVETKRGDERESRSLRRKRREQIRKKRVSLATNSKRKLSFDKESGKLKRI